MGLTLADRRAMMPCLQVLQAVQERRPVPVLDMGDAEETSGVRLLAERWLCGGLPREERVLLPPGVRVRAEERDCTAGFPTSTREGAGRE